LSALDDLQKVIFEWKDQLSVITPSITRRGNGPNYWYRLQFVEVQEEANEWSGWSSSKLDQCIEWAAERLKSWSDVRRVSWDMWDFKSRRDAEKFITIFHLSWDQ